MFSGMQLTGSKGGKGGKGAPSIGSQIGGQTRASQNTAATNLALNRFSSQDPFGQSYWVDQQGNRIDQNELNRARPDWREVASWQQRTELNPEMQSILSGLQTNARGGLGALSSPYAPDYSGARGSVEKALFDRSMGLLQPGMDEQRRSAETQLAMQGLDVGSEAYGKEMDRMQRGFEQARLNAAREAVIGGGSEQSRMAALDMATRQQNASELAQALSGISSFRSPMTPQSGMASVQAPDVMGAYANKAAADAAKKGGTTNMLGTLGAAALMSDRRTKRDISRIGRYKDYNVYQYRYIGKDDWDIGVMADEVKEINPAAVVNIGGIDHVDYGAL